MTSRRLGFISKLPLEFVLVLSLLAKLKIKQQSRLPHVLLHFWSPTRFTATRQRSPILRATKRPCSIFHFGHRMPSIFIFISKQKLLLVFVVIVR